MRFAADFFCGLFFAYYHKLPKRKEEEYGKECIQDLQ